MDKEIINKRLEQLSGKVSYFKSMKTRLTLEQVTTLLDEMDNLIQDMSSQVNRGISQFDKNPFIKS
jgi:hypothetical protein